MPGNFWRGINIFLRLINLTVNLLKKNNITATHKIEKIRFNQDFIILDINGNELTIPLDKLSGGLHLQLKLKEPCTKFLPRAMAYIGL